MMWRRWNRRHWRKLEMFVGGDPPFFLSARVTSDNLHAVANRRDEEDQPDERGHEGEDSDFQADLHGRGEAKSDEAADAL